ncbi:hypothetical protein [Salinicoccus sp. RF5]|uniref:hypothetical protein n=1 Tax=Salinicoccus sp. RF5 TaxID=2748874 RepID=UPI001E3BC067|nr:hypothetical protein [Salinicoccus sp. RF5]MCC4721820.1 hypothetical protein [Salinicoccus sp. RF5]
METIITAKGVHIIFPKDCGNAPKKRLLIDALAAFIEGDHVELEERVDIEKVRLPSLPEGVMEVKIHRVITHGKEAGVHLTVYCAGRKQVEAGAFLSFRSAANTIISKLDILVDKDR